MRFIRDIFADARQAQRPVVSFEFFPTKTPEGERTLLEKTIPALGQLNPDFCSVTYGAGGSTREKTLTIVDRIQREQGLTAMAHMTCVNATREDTASVLEQARALGITNILALRGDPPGGIGDFQKTEGGFEYSYELVRFIKEMGGFSIGVAGFPEGHIAQTDGKYADWQHLKHKIDQGADFVITQLFFSNRDYLEFRDYLASARRHRAARAGHHADSERGADQADRLHVRRRVCRSRSCRSSTSAATTTKRSRSSASSTRRASAKSCCARARRGYTSTRSTNRDRPCRSWKT